jgi:KUP system potassium uptake protein
MTKQIAKNPEPRNHHSLLTLSIGALGVVYGDIGTSPLYAMRECFAGKYGIAVSHENVLGVLSLIFWVLVVVVSIKYLALILRADNRGEGGILALMALIRPRHGSRGSEGWILVGMGLFGAALLYGDGMITPAISVLSAVEGLAIATPMFEPYVGFLTISVLVVLFSLQRRGTAGIGALFGPITLVWFVVLAALGLRGISVSPNVLAAVNPYHGVVFFLRNGGHGFLVLGAVFLVLTGAEALYADMGHFGRGPIRLTWFAIALPALLLNYFGQGALLLSDPSAAEHPFYRLAPGWGLYPLVALATAATVIASQAVISGSFSLTRQAVQLGYSPRVEIRHTSPEEIGQIYVPYVNLALMLATIGLVLGFRSSSDLAAAYGVAVTTTMTITTILFYVLARKRWQWPFWVAAPVAAVFLCIDLSFFAANMIKVEHGGWFPLLAGGAVFALMSTWKRGREVLAERIRAGILPLDRFLEDIAAHPPVRVAGLAVFMTGSPEGTPPALLHNLKHNKILHEKVVLLTIITEEVPHVPQQERLELEPLGQGFFRLVARYGFMEGPNVLRLLAQAKEKGLEFNIMQTSFFLGRETLLPSRHPAMPAWREHLFSLMSRNAQSATAFFGLPANQVVELGAQIQL